MVLISDQIRQYKANLHCHSTLSDGRLTPEELKDAYRAHGYQILAITDHESPRNHSELNGPDFLTLTGYEAYIRPDKQAAYDIFAPEVHLNLIARRPDTVTLIGYHPPYCKYLTAEQQQALEKSALCGERDYSAEYINRFIREANACDYLVFYNHPVWSMESEERILSYEGIVSMEMVNGNSDSRNHLEYNGHLYNTLLRHGKRWFVHGADDNHNVHPFSAPENDSFRAATMILCEELRYDAVMEAIAHGAMYATEGPRFEELRIEGDKLYVRCSEVAVITCHNGSKRPPSLCAEDGGTVTEATFSIDPRSPFVRVSVCDRQGKRADTRAYFPEEWV